ncbi:hypothetical protein K5Y32_10705 [Pantoea sp. DY-15]|uniref:hypothetical protein n=1 Tax=Pantoea sp. DY-15 TaxID=2871489 RepID=UPI001C96F2CD|nr:hypothetical protein [Pantoea sp. DY-15]MBY4888411.1 hypothetical protein [Pantoea sp. DY-15]
MAVIPAPAECRRRSSNDPPGETTVDSFYSVSAKQRLCQHAAPLKINTLGNLPHPVCTMAVQNALICLINERSMKQKPGIININYIAFSGLHEWHALC